MSAWRGAIKTRAKQKKKIRLPANHAAGRRACSRQSNRMRPLAGTLAGQVAATALHAPSTYIHVPRASAAPPPPSLAVAALPDGRRRRRGGCATASTASTASASQAGAAAPRRPAAALARQPSSAPHVWPGPACASATVPGGHGQPAHVPRCRRDLAWSRRPSPAHSLPARRRLHERGSGRAPQLHFPALPPSARPVQPGLSSTGRRSVITATSTSCHHRLRVPLRLPSTRDACLRRPGACGGCGERKGGERAVHAMLSRQRRGRCSRLGLPFPFALSRLLLLRVDRFGRHAVSRTHTHTQAPTLPHAHTPTVWVDGCVGVQGTMVAAVRVRAGNRGHGNGQDSTAHSAQGRPLQPASAPPPDEKATALCSDAAARLLEIPGPRRRLPIVTAGALPGVSSSRRCGLLLFPAWRRRLHSLAAPGARPGCLGRHAAGPPCHGRPCLVARGLPSCFAIASPC